jgi:hypothetical protein
VHSSAFVGNTKSLNGRYTTSEAIIHSFNDVMFLVLCMHKPGIFIRFSGYITGWKTGEFFSVAGKARIYLRCQAPTPTQAQIASYSMEICSSFLGDKAAGA